MMSLVTEFEMHRYAEEHLRCIKVVTHLFGDGDFDAGHCMVSVPTAKEFIARKTRTIAPSKEQGTKLSQDKQQSIFIHKFGNPSRIPCLSCTG
jgi:hypothetical protein